MISNRLNLKTYALCSLFNKESDHSLEVFINDQLFYKETFLKDKIYNIKIDDYFDYKDSGKKRIKFKWRGKNECQEKYLQFHRMIVHEQYIPIYSVLSKPIENEFIKNLKTSEEGRAKYRKWILFPGDKHGWYGDYSFDFLLGSFQERLEIKASEPKYHFTKFWNISPDLEQLHLLKRVKKK